MAPLHGAMSQLANAGMPVTTAKSIVVQDRGDPAVLTERRIAAVGEQVEVERPMGLPLAVALDFNRDRLRRHAGGEGQCAGLGDVVAARRSSRCRASEECS